MSETIVLSSTIKELSVKFGFANYFSVDRVGRGAIEDAILLELPLTGEKYTWQRSKGKGFVNILTEFLQMLASGSCFLYVN